MPQDWTDRALNADAKMRRQAAEECLRATADLQATLDANGFAHLARYLDEIDARLCRHVDTREGS